MKTKISDELRQEIINLPNRDLLCISAEIQENWLTITTGDMKQHTVNLSLFKPNNICSPDFTKLEIRDFGNTIAFGEYEAGVDSIVYDSGYYNGKLIR